MAMSRPDVIFQTPPLGFPITCSVRASVVAHVYVTVHCTILMEWLVCLWSVCKLYQARIRPPLKSEAAAAGSAKGERVIKDGKKVTKFCIYV